MCLEKLRVLETLSKSKEQCWLRAQEMSQVDNKKLLKTLEDFENNPLLSAEIIFIMTENLNKLSENSSKIIQTCKY